VQWWTEGTGGEGREGRDENEEEKRRTGKMSGGTGERRFLSWLEQSPKKNTFHEISPEKHEIHEILPTLTAAPESMP